MPDSRSRSKVTIEDLLKLKRAERPSADFWVRFEGELRQKQLAALMEKRSWWRDLPRLLTPRLYVPAGAAAVLAFSVIVVQRSPAPEGAVAGAPRSVAPSVVAETTSPVTAQPVSSPLVNRKEPSVLAVDDRMAIAASSVGTREPVVTPSVVKQSPAALSPSARSIAANLAQLEQSEPELIQAVLGNRLSSEPRIAVSAVPVVEFASLVAAGSKRSRLLAQYNDRQVTPTAAAPEIVRERLTRRLNELDAGDRFTRVGLKGDQVSLRF